MKRITSLFAFCIFIPFLALSQVGIGTTNPNASLEIIASNTSNPAPTDGLLIPKVDEFPATNPSGAQDGMMLYITGAGSVAKGFYHWDQTSTNWGSMQGARSIDELADGKADGSSIFLGAQSGSSDDGSSNSNVGLGRFSLQSNLDGSNNVALGHNSLSSNISGYGNIALGNSASGGSSGDLNTVIGATAFGFNATGDRNVILGAVSGRYLNGDNNVMLGYQAGHGAGNYNMSGSIFIGNNAGYYATTNNRLYIENSSSNSPLIYGEFDTNYVRIGGALNVSGALSVNNQYSFPLVDGAIDQVLRTDGSGTMSWEDETVGATSINELTDGRTISTSMFLGNNAGASDDGSSNQSIGIGQDALLNSSTGWGNISIGYHSSRSNTTGNVNTVIGHRAFQYNTTGGQNTAIGQDALFNNTTANINTAIGEGAMENTTTGGYNTAIGGSALENNTLGNRNIAIGLNALFTNTVGARNTAIGNSAGNSTNGSRNVFIGYNAGFYEVGSDKLYIENSLADKDNALLYGEFDTNFLEVNGDLQVGLPAAANVKLLSGDGNISSLKLFEGADFGYEFQYNGSTDKLHLWSRNFSGNEAVRMTWLKNGNVGIGNTNPGYRLDVAGDINTTGNIRQTGGAYSFPDYVFETHFEGTSKFNPSYKFLKLDEVEGFLRKYKHLPGVQNRQEVAVNGWNLSENIRTNLEKVEELYLHAIAANKVIVEISEENKILQQRLVEQQTKLDQLTTLVEQLMSNKK